MISLKIGVKAESFDEVLRDEMNQRVRYCGREMPFFEYVLQANVGKIVEYKDWVKDGDFYDCNVTFCDTMVLDSLKQLVRDGQILRGCVVEVFTTTSDKYGYYQVEDGFSLVGFSVKNDNWYFEKLRKDVSEMDKYKTLFKRNFKESYEEHMNQSSLKNFKTGRNMYSLFVNSEKHDRALLNNAVSRLGGVFEKALSTSNDTDLNSPNF